MHNCEEFRERITEYIIDREDLARRAEFQPELLICSGCSEFYSESREMIEALSSVDLSIAESQWEGIEHRLCEKIMSENTAAVYQPRLPASAARWHWVAEWFKAPAYGTPFLLAAAALLFITVGLSRLAIPRGEVQTAAETPQSATYVEHSVVLDPVTVDFLEQSELLLRNVMKIVPSDVEDLADAKNTAREQLAGIGLRREAAAAVPPVVDVMDTYETVLRDIRNLDERSVEEDIPDIQKRIQRNGLIANMKAFQPAVTQVSLGLQ
jgi:hypothetical protein